VNDMETWTWRAVMVMVMGIVWMLVLVNGGSYQQGLGLSSVLGCFACKHSCCFFTNCTKFQCPSCHLKLKLCSNNCRCNIFTSESKVEIPWKDDYFKTDHEYSEDATQDKEDMKFCGMPQCNKRCETGEWCANTGEACHEFPCCESSACIKFNV